MTISPAGIALIKSRETCRLSAYLCPAGIPTIGYGHTGLEVYIGMVITQEAADNLLATDLARFDQAVITTCPVAMPQQHSAMACLAFNIGPAAFASSSVVRLHNAQRYAEAAQAFGLWNKATVNGKLTVLSGLVTRRAAESQLYLSDAPLESETTDAVPAGPGVDMGIPASVIPQVATVATIAQGEKPLSQSKTIAGQAIAGAGTVAGIGLDQTHNSTAQQAQDTFAGLAPYYHWAMLAMAALAIGGLAWGMYARWEDRNSGRN